MGIKVIGGKRYCYQTYRVGDRVRSKYIGPGWMAPALEQFLAEQKAKRAARAEARRMAEERERESAEWFRRTEHAVRLYLIAAGCRQHKRQWKRTRAVNAQAVATTSPTPAGAELSLESRSVLDRFNAGDKSITAVEARRLLSERPDLIGRTVEPGEAVMLSWVNRSYPDDQVRRESLIRHYERTRDTLAGPAPTPMERFLAERAALCWLEANSLESTLAFSGKADRQSLRWVESANRRFLAALRTLATVRKLALPDLNVVFDGRAVYIDGRQSWDGASSLPPAIA